MHKIQRISEFQHEFIFSSPGERFDTFYERFLQGDLGKIYLAVPWDDLVVSFGLEDASKGPRGIFSPKGKLALMFLKHWSGDSDRKLVENLNGNLDWQFFCDLHLGERRISNFKIVSEIRTGLSKKLDIDKVQRALYGHWSPYIKDTHCIVMDATCYESHMRYPTPVKLLWETVDWLHRLLKATCREVGEPMPRSKYLKWARRYVSYSKMKRKTKKKSGPLTRGLLLLLDKFSGELDRLEEGHTLKRTADQYRRRATAKKIYAQQYAYFHHGERPSDRIVSLDKDYVRPIVRGKETRAVEFGAKVNKFQIDGIGFIEHLSFDAFHEGIRFRDTIFKAQRMTKRKTGIAGGDAIYATNKNRVFANRYGIRTDFKRKGRAGRHEAQRKKMAAAITKERASRLEGSFGTEKEHYHLKKIRARTKANETLWIFFGIHTANALNIGRRMAIAAIERAA